MRAPYRLSAEGHRVLVATTRQNRPWTRSTGPRTARGKAVVARNALKHGQRLGVVLRRLGGESAVRDAIRASLDFDAATHRQPRTALHALRRIASASKRAVRHGDATGFAGPMLDALGPLADLEPDAGLTRAEIDAALSLPGAARLRSRATWQLVAGLLAQVSSPGLNLDAIDVFLRLDGVR